MNLKASLISVAVFAISLVCIQGSERAASRQTGSDRVVVTYWEKWTGDEMQVMKRIVDRFNRSQDRIEVRMLSISGIAEKTLLATSGGNPPDVAGLWSDQVVQFADAGALTDLTEFSNEVGLGEEDFIPSYWKMMVYQGRIYAYPSSPGTAAIYVNRSLMPPEYDSAEKFPKTLEEFDRLVDKVSRKNADGTLKTIAFLPRDGWGLWNMPNLFGGSLGTSESIDVNGPDDVRAWNWVHSFAKRFGLRETQSFRSGFGNYSSPQNPFLSGKLATYSDGPWFGNFIRMYNPKIDWFAAPFPYPSDRPDAKGFTTLNLNTLLIPKGAKHPREAFEFIAYVQKQENMEELCQGQWCNSPLMNVSESFFANHPNKEIRLFDELARSPNAVAPLQLGVWNKVGSEVANAVDQIDLGQKDTVTALNEAQSRLEEAWAKYRKQVLGE